MTIKQEQMENIIKNLSKLPNIDPKMFDDTAKIIDHMKILEEVDTTGVEPTISVSNFSARLRKDVEKRDIEAKDTISCTNHKIIANQIAVPSIM
ncbi:MAG: aspartyl/glutamyl-tRNA amidotransferase subunit C [Candidatus Gracilibacteria bacterium]|nr:aspartyl/glutamyl-tRNA amidotransferase subunit C [Candidatus Gracilibacteria bacterium]MDQ7023116.1 aspartyl/glutamyl-tRNA amidotransferase subunit C [Candidatus Gracilibacteria bacterium]